MVKLLQILSRALLILAGIALTAGNLLFGLDLIGVYFLQGNSVIPMDWRDTVMNLALYPPALPHIIGMVFGPARCMVSLILIWNVALPVCAFAAIRGNIKARWLLFAVEVLYTANIVSWSFFSRSSRDQVITLSFPFAYAVIFLLSLLPVVRVKR